MKHFRNQTRLPRKVIEAMTGPQEKGVNTSTHVLHYNNHTQSLMLRAGVGTRTH